MPAKIRAAEPCPTTDYLAIILCGGGSAWGRSPDKAEAVKGALKVYKRDWGSLFKITKGDEVKINIVDVYPHDEVSWGSDGFYADGAKITPKVEHLTALVP